MRNTSILLLIMSFFIILSCDPSLIGTPDFPGTGDAEQNAPEAIVNLSAQNNLNYPGSIEMNWTLPSDTTVSGILLLSSDQSISWTPTDGQAYTVGNYGGFDILVAGTDSSKSFITPEKGTHYYFRAFTYNDSFKYSDALEEDILYDWETVFVFLLDGSGSVGSSGWSKMISWLSGLLDLGADPELAAPQDEYLIRRDGTVRLGCVTFASTATTNLALTLIEDDSINTITDSIDSLGYPEGGTNYLLGYQEAVTMASSYTSTENLPVHRIIYQITDGNPYPVTDIDTVRDLLKNSGIENRIIGVGNSYSKDILESYLPDGGMLLEIGSYSGDDAFDAITTKGNFTTLITAYFQ